MSAKKVFIVAQHDPRTLVETLDFVTTIPSRPPAALITDLAVLAPSPEDGELVLVSLHPGVTEDDVLEKTGWTLKIGEDVVTSDAPTPEELEVLRQLYARTNRAHGQPP